MKKVLMILGACAITIASQAQSYTPTAENIKARQEFRDDKFGLFIHWGPFSIPGDGEWVMNNKNIPYKNYKRLMNFF